MFDPDAFLAEGGTATQEAPAGFDPDAFLAESEPFNPDKFLTGELTSEQIADYDAQMREMALGPQSPIGATARLGVGLELPLPLDKPPVQEIRADPTVLGSLREGKIGQAIGAGIEGIRRKVSTDIVRLNEEGRPTPEQLAKLDVIRQDILREHGGYSPPGEFARRAAEAGLPNVTDWIFNTPIATLNRPEGEAYAGVRAFEESVEGLGTLTNALIATGLPGAAKPVQKAVGAYFAGTMGKEAAGEVPAIVEGIAEGDLTAAGEATVRAGTGALFSIGAGAHAFGRPRATARTTEARKAVMAQKAAELREVGAPVTAAVLEKQASDLPPIEPITGGPVKEPPVRDPAAPPTEGLPEGFVSVGASTGADIPAPGKIGGYNADVEAHQKARGQTPTMSEARKEDPVTWDSAMDVIEKDPVAPEKLVEAIHADPKKPLTDEQQQMLTWRRGDLENKMAQEAERAIDPNLSPDEQAVHQSNAELLESQLLRTEQANRIAGTASGRSLRSRQLEMNDDYTFAGLMMRRRKLTGEVVPPDVRAQIKAQADEIAVLRKNAEKTDAIEVEAKQNAALAATYEATIADLQKAEAARPKYGKSILDRAERIVAKLEEKAVASDAFIRNSLGKTSALVDPMLLYHVGVTLAAKIGRFGLDKVTAFAEMRAKYGEGIEPYLEDGWGKAQKIIGSSGETGTREIVEKGVSKPAKGEKTTAEAGARLKAEAAAKLPMSHRGVYELVRSLLNAGVAEKDALAEAHRQLTELYPDVTPREVRNAFVDYGKIKYPSKEDTAVKLRHLRAIEKIDEDITRIEEGLAGKIDPETGKPTREKKIGMQRDKPDQPIRDLQKKRNDLLKLVPEDAASAATLASRDAAKQTALRNAIEDLDSKLKGKVQAERIAGQPDSPATEQLRAELEAMRELDREIEAAKNPPPPEHEVELKKLQDRADVLRDRLARMELTQPKAEGKPTADTAEIAAAKAEIKTLTETMAELRKPVPPSPAQKALDAALVARERAGQTLDDISTGKTKPADLTKEALTQLEEDIRLETDALKKLAAEMRRDAKPKADPSAAKEQAQIKALETAIDRYAKKTAAAFAPPTGRIYGPDTARVARLNEVRDSRKAAYETKFRAERYNATQTKNIERQIKEAERRLRDRDFGPRVKKIQPALTRANLDAKAKLEKAKNEVRQGEERFRLANRTGLQKAKERSLLALQSVRGIVLGSDIGVLTRQGLFSWARPVKAVKAAATAFKAALSPESMGRWEIEMRDKVVNGEAAAPIRKAADLSVTDTITHPEELVVTRLLSRIPDFNVGGKTVRLSAVARTLERFQTTFINAVRIEVFDAGIKSGMSPVELTRLAHFINNATGRGNIKLIPKAMSVLMTSPRYEFSRWGTLLEPIHNLGALARRGVKGELDKAAISNLKDIAVVVAGIYGLFKLAENSGYQVNWDPESADFLKMRKGDEVWDVSAGLSPRIRDVVRIFVAWDHPTYSKNIGKTLLNAGLRTINPAIKTAIDQTSIIKQRFDGVKEPVLPFSGFRSEEEREGLIALAPLIVQSTKEALEDGPGQAAFTAAREFVGSSVQRYPEKESK